MSLKDHVYKYISDQLKEGSLKPNEKINEQDLSDRLDVSRTPVREALIQLEAEGLLVSEPRRGFRVKPLTHEEAKELYQIIGTLDAMAALLSLDNIRQRDISMMKELHKSMDKAIQEKDFDEYYKLQIDFHNVYLSKCPNKELIKLLNRLKLRFIKQGYSDKDPNELTSIFTETNNQHLIIVQLFDLRDKQKLDLFLKEKHWSVDYAILDVI